MYAPKCLVQYIKTYTTKANDHTSKPIRLKPKLYYSDEFTTDTQ